MSDERARSKGVDPLSMFDLGLWRDRQATVVDPDLCEAAFEDGFDAATEEPEAARALVIDEDALRLFGREDHLDMSRFVEAHTRVSQERLRRIERLVRPNPELDAHRAAGRFAGDCVLLRLVARETSAPDGVTQFRLRHREPQFARVGGKARRVRGLTPTEIRQRDRRDRAAARRRETLDQRARDAATLHISRSVDGIVRRHRGFLIPRSWHEAGFLPAELVGRSLAAAAPFVVGRHQADAFDRGKLQAWEACLERTMGGIAKWGGDAAPDDDLRSLGSLARTSDAWVRRQGGRPRP